MAASTFDALEASRKLKQAGIDDQHAEAIADQLRSAAGADLDQLATKAELRDLATRDDIAGLRGDLGMVQRDVASLVGELRIVKWAMAFQGAVSLATLAAVLGLAWKVAPMTDPQLFSIIGSVIGSAGAIGISLSDRASCASIARIDRVQSEGDAD